MYFRILHDAASGELSYLLADLDTRDVVLVDPHGRDMPVLLALLAEHELQLRWVLRTHQHDDLQPEEPALLKRLGAPLIQAADRQDRHGAVDGDILPFGNEFVRVLATPGHTTG